MKWKAAIAAFGSPGDVTCEVRWQMPKTSVAFWLLKRGPRGVNLRALPYYGAPTNRNHAAEHERESEFRIGNETGDPPWRGHLPVECWRAYSPTRPF
jgi:hypothetical protein